MFIAANFPNHVYAVRSGGMYLDELIPHLIFRRSARRQEDFAPQCYKHGTPNGVNEFSLARSVNSS